MVCEHFKMSVGSVCTECQEVFGSVRQRVSENGQVSDIGHF